MFNLLGIEWMKIKNYRTFWILLAIMVVSIPAFNYAVSSFIKINISDKAGGHDILGSPFGLPEVWHTITWFSCLLFVLPAILVITLTTNEFTFKTHRQNIIDGWSRGSFIGVKLIGILLLSLLGTLVVMFTVLIFGWLGTRPGHAVSIWQGSRFLFFYFVQMVSYLMIAFVLAVLIKRSGLAIGLFLIYMIVEQVVVLILNNALHFKPVLYLPEETTDQLIPLPFMQIPPFWEHQIAGHLVVALVYLILYCLLTSRYFLRSDL